jgi:hypothetical protein
VAFVAVRNQDRSNLGLKPLALFWQLRQRFVPINERDATKKKTNREMDWTSNVILIAEGFHEWQVVRG